MTDLDINLATSQNLEDLLPLMRAYHDFEEISMSDVERRNAVSPLLADDALGRIWLIYIQGNIVGYIVITFGYSIELRGQDAYIDEFFIRESSRGLGLGSKVVARVKSELVKYNIVALHLEVAKTNEQAKRFYVNLGFVARDRYELMSVTIRTSLD